MNSRCAACPRTHKQVLGYGARPAKVMLIGEGPGRKENDSGMPFIGPSGQELDETYLPLAGLEREGVYVTNCVQCRCERDGQDVKPPDSLMRTCAANHIPGEIAAVQPEIILLVGATACELAGGIDLELEHGRPREMYSVAALGGWSGTVVPMYHPAAGMRDGRFMIYALEDFEKFGLWLSGNFTYPFAPRRHTHYSLIQPGGFSRALAGEPVHYNYLPVDTESDEGRVWSIQFSTRPGTAFMIRTDDRELVSEFARWLERTYNSRVVMHNAIHDLDELDQLGIHVRAHRDTQQELYHLGNLPQGLKAAVYRTLGHRMVSYMETVVPHSRAVLDAWLGEAMVWASDHRTVEPHPPGAGCPTCGKKHRLDVSKFRPHACEAVIRRIMGKLSEPGSKYDPWQKPKLSHGAEKPRLLGREWLGEIEAEAGRMPRQSIVHVPLDEAVRYGCSDADWTGKLSVWLEGERVRIMNSEWRVAA